MTFAIGGTAKVRRIVKQARTEPWMCKCVDASFAGRIIDPALCGIRKEHPASLMRCPDCGTKRP